jgi:hypothetical protein
MSDALPFVPISPEQLQYLFAAMLVYQQYRLRKTPPSEERSYTLLVLTFLLPKLQRGIEPHEGEMPLLLTVDDVQVMKGGLTVIIDRLNRKSVPRKIKQKITHLKALKTMLEQNFSTTQD